MIIDLQIMTRMPVEQGDLRPLEEESILNLEAETPLDVEILHKLAMLLEKEPKKLLKLLDIKC